MTRRTRPTAALAALAVLGAGLTGCGNAGPLGSSVVGLHDAPAEATGAAIRPERAQAELVRALDRAKAVSTDTGKDGDAQRATAYNGPALHEANRLAYFRKQGGKVTPMVTTSADAKVLAVSRGSEWPRAVLGTMLVDGVQKLFAVVSTEPGQPYKLFAITNMEPGASIPALGPTDQGVRLATDGDGLVESPRRIAHEWGKAMAFPVRRSFRDVAIDDDFSAALRTNAREQQKEFGGLANLRQHHLSLPNDTIAFELQNGGAISLSGMRRRDIVTITSKGRKLVLPADLAEIVGRKAVKERLEKSTLETVAFIIPERGDAEVVAAREQVSAAWAR